MVEVFLYNGREKKRQTDAQTHNIKKKYTWKNSVTEAYLYLTAYIVWAF